MTWRTVTLVNRDQLDILKTLRESVNEDKAELEAEVDRLRTQVKELSDKNKMQLEQINGLLLEKVNLQSEGIDQRDRMLQRERAIGWVTRIVGRMQRLLSFAVATSARLFLGRTCPKISSSACLPFTRRTSASRSSTRPLKRSLSKRRRYVPFRYHLVSHAHVHAPIVHQAAG